MSRRRRAAKSSRAFPRALVDVLEGAARGESVNETAKRRVVSPTTVRAQRREILARLRAQGIPARNITQAVAVASRERLFEDAA